jgi:hypothetical protein
MLESYSFKIRNPNAFFHRIVYPPRIMSPIISLFVNHGFLMRGLYLSIKNPLSIGLHIVS